MISSAIFAAVGAVLFWVAIGILILPVLVVLNVVFPIVATVKCNNGETWSCPLAIRNFDED